MDLNFIQVKEANFLPKVAPLKRRDASRLFNGVIMAHEYTYATANSIPILDVF
jgi:hypothetical protein